MLLPAGGASKPEWGRAGLSSKEEKGTGKGTVGNYGRRETRGSRFPVPVVGRVVGGRGGGGRPPSGMQLEAIPHGVLTALWWGPRAPSADSLP